MYHILLICLLVVEHVDYFSFLPIMNNAAVNIIYKLLCGHVFSVLGGILGVDVSVFRVVILPVVTLLRAECWTSDVLCCCGKWPPRSWTFKKFTWGFPGGPVFKTPHFNCQGHGFIPTAS